MALIVVLPSLILLAVFVYGFIAQTVYISLTDWGQGAALALKPDTRFVGAYNYREMFTGFLNVRFRQDLVNMVFFTVLFVAASLGLGLMLATILDQRIRGEAFFRTVFLFPMSLSFIVTGTIWRWLLQPRGGVNVLPSYVGLPPASFLWLSSRDQALRFNWQALPIFAVAVAAAAFITWAAWLAARRRLRAAALAGLPGVVLMAWSAAGGLARLEILPFEEPHGFNLALIGVVIAATWQMSGYTMALYLAGLRTIPDELREAARVDGASPLQVYRYVELPLLTPITWSAVIVLGHIALKIFDLVFAMAGPDNAPTSVPAILMFLTTFRGNELAKGASIAVVLLVMVSFLIIPYLVATFRGRRA
ncbi:MAG: sugar ABC transporter permease [Firmicutes bacterium]|jgi:glucose/mannose transport system permease protein|nr:sugar ABC transporter permease [Bacillota bacterium]MDH7495283.1 sugar ABC transporter permease [Bacillota bacterium]